MGACADRIAPVAAFPSHWGPNSLAIYNAKAFPAAYRGGAFIAFHGSWNRSPAVQDGFNVVFQPLKDGKANGNYKKKTTPQQFVYTWNVSQDQYGQKLCLAEPGKAADCYYRK